MSAFHKAGSWQTMTPGHNANTNTNERVRLLKQGLVHFHAPVEIIKMIMRYCPVDRIMAIHTGRLHLSALSLLGRAAGPREIVYRPHLEAAVRTYTLLNCKSRHQADLRKGRVHCVNVTLPANKYLAEINKPGVARFGQPALRPINRADPMQLRRVLVLSDLFQGHTVANAALLTQRRLFSFVEEQSP
jgi:hypothetical protein